MIKSALLAHDRKKDRMKERTEREGGQRVYGALAPCVTAAPPFGAKNEQWADLMHKSGRNATKELHSV